MMEDLKHAKKGKHLLLNNIMDGLFNKYRRSLRAQEFTFLPRNRSLVRVHHEIALYKDYLFKANVSTPSWGTPVPLHESLHVEAEEWITAHDKLHNDMRKVDAYVTRLLRCTDLNISAYYTLPEQLHRYMHFTAIDKEYISCPSRDNQIVEFQNNSEILEIIETQQVMNVLLG